MVQYLMADPVYTYCPVCATPLAEQLRFDRPRPVCPACGFIHFLDPKLVAVVVVEHAGQILLARRNTEPGRGQWSFLGGYVDRGERVEDAAIREVREEANLDVVLDGLLGLYSAPGRTHVVAAYRAHVAGGDISRLAAQADEVGELAFFAPAALPALAFGGDAAIWADWQRARGAAPGP
ncbi:MAG TPA: NUDIX hydrolase [Chloroflexia bacterium]|nr:NUDIX hydrolase [Chloroflexia bacterium]